MAYTTGFLLLPFLVVGVTGCSAAKTSPADRPTDGGHAPLEAAAVDAGFDGTPPDGSSDAAGPEDAPLDAALDAPDTTDASDSGADASDSGTDASDSGTDAADAADATSLDPRRPEIVCATSPTTAPDPSTFFTDASVAMAASIDVPSDGNLWPSCWSGDTLYAGWGDGFGFSDAGAYPRPSIGVAGISGDPSAPDAGAMTGATLVHDGSARAIFKVWTGGSYYQKPTGMLCLGGKIYLAVQDLNASDYGDAPAATIAVSTDAGQTWSEDETGPMFSSHEFTTMMFLDYGQDSSAIGAYVYVYGLDYNWRWSPDITSPQGLYLARVPMGSDLLDRTQWEFFADYDSPGNPTWTSDFAARLPVLVDCTRRYATPTFSGYTVISQGSIVYDAPLQRYLYTSWTEYTYEFYEAPQPWGPWRKFLFADFGPYPWTEANSGGYAATVPSKYISPGGGTMWLQSNTWSSGIDHNDFALRTLQLWTAP